MHYSTIVDISEKLRQDLERSIGAKLNLVTEQIELDKQLIKIPLDAHYTTKRVVQISWEEHLKEIAKDTREQIDKVMLFSHLIDFNTILHLTKVYDCSLFTVSNMIAPSHLLKGNKDYIQYSNMNVYTGSIASYFMLINKLISITKIKNCR